MGFGSKGKAACEGGEAGSRPGGEQAPAGYRPTKSRAGRGCSPSDAAPAHRPSAVFANAHSSSLPLPGHLSQPAGSRNGLGRPRVALNGQVGSWVRQTCPSLPSAWEQPLSSGLHLFQPPGGVPGTQPLLPNSMDPTRQQGQRAGWAAQGLGSGRGSFSLLLPLSLTAHLLSHAGHPNMGGSMQRMNPPRGMGPMGPGPQVTLCVHPFP